MGFLGENRICKRCRRGFTAQRSTKKFCSDKCRVAYNRAVARRPKPVDHYDQARAAITHLSANAAGYGEDSAKSVRHLYALAIEVANELPEAYKRKLQEALREYR